MQTTTLRLAPSTTIRRARVLRCFFEITDDSGTTNLYTVKPVDPGPHLAVYRMARLAANRRTEEAVYHAALDQDGCVACNCKGGLGNGHCKHVATLEAMGCFMACRLLLVRKLTLELEQRLAQAEAENRDRKIPRTLDGRVANPWGC